MGLAMATPKSMWYDGAVRKKKKQTNNQYEIIYHIYLCSLNFGQLFFLQSSP